MTNHPMLCLGDVYAATLPALKFSPSLHVNYAEMVLPMRDGLPKFKDLPKEFGLRRTHRGIALTIRFRISGNS
jgi:hypothetical protein